MPLAAVSFTDVVVAIHVMAVIAAFGVWFAWPLLPGGTPEAHRARGRILQRLVTPAATVALVLGLYLAGDEGVFGQLWVLVPLVILVALLGLTGAVLTPLERDLAGHAGPGGDAAAYARARTSVQRAIVAGVVLVLVATLFMVTKLGGTRDEGDQDAAAAASRNAVANVSAAPDA